MILEGWLSHLVAAYPGIVAVVVITGLLLMFIASVIRALQRWEIIPDPLLPEKWRNRWYALQRKVLDASADEKTYRAISSARSPGPDSTKSGGGASDRSDIMD
jgi:hypothetical protein